MPRRPYGLPGIESNPKPGIRIAALQTEARALSKPDATRQLNRTRTALFRQIFKPRKSP